MSARKRVRAYLAAASAQYSGERVATYGGHTLTIPDLQTLLDSERAARAEIQTLQCKYTAALKALSGRARRASEQEDENRKLTAERDREREHATRLAKKLDTLRAAPGTVNYQGLYNELLPKAKRAERDLYNEQQRSARLQEALDSAAREAASRTYADILQDTAGEDLVRGAVDGLLKFLRSGK